MSAAAETTKKETKGLLKDFFTGIELSTNEQGDYLKFAYNEPTEKTPVKEAIKELYEEGVVSKNAYNAFLRFVANKEKPKNGAAGGAGAATNSRRRRGGRRVQRKTRKAQRKTRKN